MLPTPEDDERASALATNGLDRERVLRLAGHHRVAPLMHASLLRPGAPRVPASLVEGLRKRRASILRSNLLKYTAWLRLCDAFGERGLTAVTLKGFPTALRLYGDAGLRPVGDLDFLVPESDVRDALRVLADAGYPPLPKWASALKHAGLEHVMKHSEEMSLGNGKGITVDLHWRTAWIGGSFPATEILAAPGSLRTNGRDVAVPAPDVDLAFLVLHGHGCGWLRLRWLVDVAEALDALPAEDAPAALRRIDGVGARPALQSALWLIQSLWKRTPASCSGLACEPGAPPRMVPLLVKALEEDRNWWHRGGGFERAATAFQRRRALTGSVASAVAFVARPEWPDWAFLALPRHLRFAYWVIRPLRLLLKSTLGRTLKRLRPSRLVTALR